MPEGRRPIVVVVDDDEAVRDSIKFLLETAGLDVDTYASAYAFLAAPRLGHRACLLLDQHMPRMTGLDLLQVLRQSGRDIPVALMTASPSPDLVRRALELGARVVLEKPLPEGALLRFVEGALD